MRIYPIRRRLIFTWWDLIAVIVITLFLTAAALWYLV